VKINRRILGAIRNPRKTFRYLELMLRSMFLPQKKVLVMIGVDISGELDILHKGYEKCYCFEANPERFNKLSLKYNKKSNIHLYNVAVADYDGEIEFNISKNNNGASSSIGNFNQEWLNDIDEKDVVMIDKIKVPCINLLNFFKKNEINWIDDYVSDIQGMDLQVLKTIKPFVDERRIGAIRCEVTKDEYKNVYYDLPDNSLSAYQELLQKNYCLIAQGTGILKDYVFDPIPQKSWEMDCKWKLN
jgi:FkbM family methyltransferase